MPARVQLVIAANPCPCGNAGSPETAMQCRCTPIARTRYLGRISGPIADRVDIRLTVRRVSSALRSAIDGNRPTSPQLRERVIAARQRAAARLRGTPWRVNGEVEGRWFREGKIRLPRTDSAVLDRALELGSLTMRGYDRALKVAWTISDLSGRERPGRAEIAEALALRGGAAL